MTDYSIRALQYNTKLLLKEDSVKLFLNKILLKRFKGVSKKVALLVILIVLCWKSP